MKKIVLFLSLAFVALAIQSCGSSSTDGGGGGDGDGVREWTYMVYMGGDNSLSEAAFDDIAEMESVGSNADLAIVVEAEFSSSWSLLTPALTDKTFHCYVDGDDGCTDMSDGESIGNVNMTDPAELQAFIEWAIEQYPADNYALIIWDHGGGWKNIPIERTLKRGAVMDDTSALNAVMSLPDLANAVEAAEAAKSEKIDLVNFDACLMGMYEVAYEFNGMTDYMVFSEETEPGDGDPYNTILHALKAAPSTTPAQLASSIVEKYAAFYEGGGATTKSAVDMSQLGALDSAVLELAAALNADPASTAVVSAAANGGTLDYANPDNHDLYDLATYLIAEMPGTDVATAAATVQTAVTSFVSENGTTGASMADSRGVAIWLPLTGEASVTDLSDYALLASNSTTRALVDGTWGDFVNTYIGASGGDPLVETTGDFAVKITWTDADGGVCDADLDLDLYEPFGGDYYMSAPWVGPSAINGTFSDDSHDDCYDDSWVFDSSCTNYESEESFEANATVAEGVYYFLANYTGNGSGCSSPLVHYLVKESGAADYVEMGSETLDASNPYGAGACDSSDPAVYSVCQDAYSDWWFLGTETRADGGAGLIGDSMGSKTGAGHLFTVKKGK